MTERYLDTKSLHVNECCIQHLNDIIYYKKIIEEHLERLSSVLRALSPEKCKLFHREVRYVGCLISAEEVKLLSKAS